MDSGKFIDSLNTKAIYALDEGKVDLAKKIFYRNYRVGKSPMTMINLAGFLIDEHNNSHRNTLFASIAFYIRICRAKRILENCNRSFSLDNIAEYHADCLLGRIELYKHHYTKAEKYYLKALYIKEDSTEVLSMLSWISVLFSNHASTLYYLKKLSGALKLTNDIAKDANTIFEECPMLVFPFYQLLIYALSYKDSNRAKDILKQLVEMIKADGESVIPTSDIILLCILLDCCSDIEYLMERFLNEPWEHKYTSVNAVLWALRSKNLQTSQIDYPNINDYIRSLSKLSPFVSKLEYFWKRISYKDDLKMMFKTQYIISFKSCHYLQCPIHKGYGDAVRFSEELQ